MGIFDAKWREMEEARMMEGRTLRLGKEDLENPRVVELLERINNGRRLKNKGVIVGDLRDDDVQELMAILKEQKEAQLAEKVERYKGKPEEHVLRAPLEWQKAMAASKDILAGIARHEKWNARESASPEAASCAEHFNLLCEMVVQMCGELRDKFPWLEEE